MHPRIVQDPQCRIPCARHITRRRERPLQDHLDVQILQNTPSDIQHPDRDALLARTRYGDRGIRGPRRLVRRGFVVHSRSLKFASARRRESPL